MNRIFILCISVLAVSSCVSNGSHYSDREILFAPAEKSQPKVMPCNVTGDMQQAQNNPACIGKTLRPANGKGGTITILKPGLAVPLVNITDDNLAAPAK